MALYTLTEFASYVQSDVDTATALLLRDLVTGLIEAVDGNDYTTAAPSAAAKAVALEAAARGYLNPQGYTSETIGEYTYRREGEAAERGIFLTAAEVGRLRTTRPRNRSVVLQLPT